ncbi:hypothetical protein COBT_004176, partial [Conglomerata obtusa]
LNLNKKNFDYIKIFNNNLLSHKSSNYNCSKLKTYTQKCGFDSLVDTGAEVSIIHVNFIPKTQYIIPIDGVKIISASGNPLSIIK